MSLPKPDRSQDAKGYPRNWPKIAEAIKQGTGWRCEACDVPHGSPPHVLTVDHLNFVKTDCRRLNLLALCQSCHLKRQGMSPPPLTKSNALARLRERINTERQQLSLRLPSA